MEKVNSCPIQKIAVRASERLCKAAVGDPSCREAVEAIGRRLSAISRGSGEAEDVEVLEAFSERLLRASDQACVDLGRDLAHLLSEQRDILISHLEAHYCPSGECSELTPAPCQLACPAHIDAPSYIALTGLGRYREALDVLREDLPLPGTLGRVCVRPCESACRRGEMDAPIAVCQLKRFAVDRAYEEEDASPMPAPQRYEEKIAIIGSGPAGLSAAYFLAKRGYRPTVFEAMPEPGGMLRWGIPAYRLPRPFLRKEIDYVLSMGVTLKTSTALGKDVSFEELKQEGFQAIFLATGAWRSLTLPIQGVKDNPCVIDCLTFLREEGRSRLVAGKKVAVLGGGNAAIDCVRTALRGGAEEVQLVYRRSRREMPAHQEEVLAAEEEGAVLKFLSTPVRILSADGRTTGLECIRNELSEPDDSGRRRPVPIEGSEFVVASDLIIPAIGQEVNVAPFEGRPDLELSRRKLVIVNPATMETSLPGVFAAGDLVTGPSTVIEAVAGGKAAADSIHRQLRGLAPREDAPLLMRRRRAPVLKITAEEKAYPARPAMPHLDAESRVHSFQEVETGLCEEDALREAKRCLRCDVCMACGRCVEACRDQLGVDAIHLAYAAQGENADTDFFRPAERCIGCGSCSVNCPTHAITVEDSGDERSIRMCGAEMSRHCLVRCASCGEPFISEKHLAYIRKRDPHPVRRGYPRDLCPSCSRRAGAAYLEDQFSPC